MTYEWNNTTDILPAPGIFVLVLVKQNVQPDIDDNNNAVNVPNAFLIRGAGILKEYECGLMWNIVDEELESYGPFSNNSALKVMAWKYIQ